MTKTILFFLFPCEKSRVLYFYVWKFQIIIREMTTQPVPGVVEALQVLHKKMSEASPPGNWFLEHCEQQTTKCSDEFCSVCRGCVVSNCFLGTGRKVYHKECVAPFLESSWGGGGCPALLCMQCALAEKARIAIGHCALCCTGYCETHRRSNPLVTSIFGLKVCPQCEKFCKSAMALLEQREKQEAEQKEKEERARAEEAQKRAEEAKALALEEEKKRRIADDAANALALEEEKKRRIVDDYRQGLSNEGKICEEVLRRFELKKDGFERIVAQEVRAKRVDLEQQIAELEAATRARVSQEMRRKIENEVRLEMNGPAGIKRFRREEEEEEEDTPPPSPRWRPSAPAPEVRVFVPY